MTSVAVKLVTFLPSLFLTYVLFPLQNKVFELHICLHIKLVFCCPEADDMSILSPSNLDHKARYCVVYLTILSLRFSQNI
jgi:hypothetical protein